MSTAGSKHFHSPKRSCVNRQKTATTRLRGKGATSSSCDIDAENITEYETRWCSERPQVRWRFRSEKAQGTKYNLTLTSNGNRCSRPPSSGAYGCRSDKACTVVSLFFLHTLSMQLYINYTCSSNEQYRGITSMTRRYLMEPWDDISGKLPKLTHAGEMIHRFN